MKNAPVGMDAFLASTNQYWRADLFTFVLGGVTYRWTTSDGLLSTGGNSWLADGTVLRRNNVRITSQLEVDAMDVDLAGVVSVASKTVFAQALDGLFDEGTLRVDYVIGASPGDMRFIVPAWFAGRVAGVEPSLLNVRLTVVSELDILAKIQLPVATMELGCTHAVYDGGCQLLKATFTVAGAASGTPTTTNVPTASAAVTAKAADYFNLGVMVFTSGALTNVRRAVKSWDGTNLVPQIPWPSAPAAGDAFTVYPGCDRGLNMCVNKFNNRIHFRGFPHMPTTDGVK